MTNEKIILNESVSLMEQGILKGTGKYVQIETDLGTKTVELPETIHTFNGWKERGYSVKKGEKSKIKFPIWKHTTKILDTNTGNPETDKMNEEINKQGGQTNMFMKTASFFTFEQVEPIREMNDNE